MILSDEEKLREKFRQNLINCNTHFDNDQMHDILAIFSHVISQAALTSSQYKGLDEKTITEIIDSTLTDDAIIILGQDAVEISRKWDEFKIEAHYDLRRKVIHQISEASKVEVEKTKRETAEEIFKEIAEHEVNKVTGDIYITVWSFNELKSRYGG